MKEHASKWREIGIQLGFSSGELSMIQNRPLLLVGAPGSWLRELLEKWFQRTDRESTSLNALKRALLEAGLGKTAYELAV